MAASIWFRKRSEVGSGGWSWQYCWVPSPNSTTTTTSPTSVGVDGPTPTSSRAAPGGAEQEALDARRARRVLEEGAPGGQDGDGREEHPGLPLDHRAPLPDPGSEPEAIHGPAALTKIIHRPEWAYAGVRTTRRRSELPVWRLIGFLLVVWLVVTVIGAVVKGLFWLAVVGVLFFVATAALGASKRKQLPGPRR